MTLPIEQTTSLPELTAAESISGTDLLLITRTGASLKAAASLLLAYIVEHFDLSAFATLSSPTLTGTPTGPTADPDTDTEQLATTAFVQAAKSALLEAISALTAGSVGADPAGTASSAITAHNDATDPHGDRAFATSAIATAIANLVGTAPETLNALNEIANALGNDPNFATTVLAALGNRVRFDAPQTLTDPQKAQARENIGAAAQSDLSSLSLSVGFTLRFDTAEQGLTTTQKNNALTNLGIGSNITQINGLSPAAGDFLQFVGTAWASRTVAQVKTALSIAVGDVSGAQAAITASGLLKGDGSGGVTAAVAGADYADTAAITNTAKVIERIDDLDDITESNARSVTGNLSAITCAELTAAGLNWSGAGRLKAGSSGGYYRLLSMGKTVGANFTIQPSRGVIECVTAIYVPACNSALSNYSSVWAGWISNDTASVGTSAFLATLHFDADQVHNNWRLRIGASTYVETSVPFALNTEYKLKVKVSRTGSTTTCTAYINGTQVATTTIAADDSVTWIPAVGETHGGASSNDLDVWIDYLGWRQTLNAARTNFGF